MNDAYLEYVHGIKRTSMILYLRAMAFFIFPGAIVVGVVVKILGWPFWFGFAIMMPWSVFWGLFFFRRYIQAKKEDERNDIG